MMRVLPGGSSDDDEGVLTCGSPIDGETRYPAGWHLTVGPLQYTPCFFRPAKYSFLKSVPDPSRAPRLGGHERDARE